MQQRRSFVQVECAGKKNQTRRDKLLAEMELVVPLTRLVDSLRPPYQASPAGVFEAGNYRQARRDGLVRRRFSCLATVTALQAYVPYLPR